MSLANEQVVVRPEHDSLAAYIAAVHKTDAGEPAIPPQHLLEQVIPVLENDSLGHTVIIAPPGSAKTNTMIAAAAYWLGNDPTQHLAFICNTDRKAYERSVAVRDTLERNPEYHSIFPGVRPDKVKGWAEFGWYLDRPNLADKDPSFAAAGVGSSIIGARLHRGILDDIADEINMATPLQREKVRRWLSKTFMTRFVPGGRAVMICTRWHEEDPAAWAIEQGWHVVHIKALDELGRSYWPAWWPSELLACPDNLHATEGQCCKKRELGSLGFGQQYQGEVVDEETALFKRGWWKRFDVLPAEAKAGGIFVDTAGWEDKPGSDYIDMAVWLTDGVRFFHPDRVRGRMEFPETIRACLDLRAKYARLPIVIEDVAWAKPLIQALKRVVPGIIPWKIEGRSKPARARSIMPLVEAGNCYLPKDAPWVGDFIEELTNYRGRDGDHDDQVDTTSMALMRLSGWQSARSRPHTEQEREAARRAAQAQRNSARAEQAAQERPSPLRGYDFPGVNERQRGERVPARGR